MEIVRRLQFLAGLGILMSGTGCVPVYGDSPVLRAAVTTMYFNQSASDTVRAISGGCVQQGFSVTGVGDDHIVCSKAFDGNAGGQTLNVRYQVLPYGGGTKVEYASYLEVQTPDGPKRTPFSSKSNSSAVQALLKSLGATAPQ